MPQNITDVNAFTSPIVAPADGDPEGASSVLSGFQALANRTAFLNQLRAVANGIATLDGASHVVGAQLPYGLANGIAQADGNGRTPAASVRNGIISDTSASFTSGPGTTYATTTSASYVDVGSSLLAVTGAQINDLLRISVSLRLVAGANGAFSRLIVVDGSGTNALQEFGHGNSVDCIPTFVTTFTVLNAGTQTVKVQYRSNTSGTQSAYSVSYSVALVRP